MSLPFVVLVASIRNSLKSRRRKIIIHAVHTQPLPQIVLDIARQNRSFFRVEFISFEEKSDFVVKRHVSQATFVRLKLPELLPGIDRVLYLDADTIVLRPIDELFDTDMEGFAVAACQDMALTLYAVQLGLALDIKTAVTRGRGIDILEYLRDVIGLQRGHEDDYFNSGVLLLDLRKWRNDRIADRVRAWSLSHPESVFHDQDALNATFKGAYAKLDLRWNTPPTSCDIDYLKANNVSELGVAEIWARDPWIIHYTGPAKPWRPVPYSSIYDYVFWKYAVDTPAFERLKTEAFEPDVEKGLLEARLSKDAEATLISRLSAFASNMMHRRSRAKVSEAAGGVGRE